MATRAFIIINCFSAFPGNKTKIVSNFKYINNFNIPIITKIFHQLISLINHQNIELPIPLYNTISQNHGKSN